MKNKIFSFALIIFFALGFAQNATGTEDQSIRKSVVFFANTIKYKQLDKTIDCIYPKYFTVFPKEQMTQILNMTYNNPFVKIDVKDMKFVSVGKPELVDGEYFSLVSYFLKMRADVSSMNEDMKKNISKMLSSKYGKNNIEYNAKEGAYTINAPMSVYAISKDKKTWKVVYAEKELKSQLTKVLPKKILDKM
ncbi:hypothetical protein [Chryseobacterium sp.]|uniref:hypothetical protein n=1 Tax=Chryseobacterium sp. TaxID=1871047 RepID=UPI00289816EB|nr:hypothetical protein [Chryseobacterium sp.]